MQRVRSAAGSRSMVVHNKQASIYPAPAEAERRRKARVIIHIA